VNHVSEMTFDEENQVIIYADGSRAQIEVNEDGDFVMPDGLVAKMWDGLSPEKAVLPYESFVCHEGRIFGIRVPVKGAAPKRRRRQQEVFSYVIRNPLPNLDPMEIYLDIQNDLKQFFLYPPLDDYSEEWRLWYRYAEKGSKAWADSRLFKLGERHPCEDEDASDDDDEEDEETDAENIVAGEDADGPSDAVAAQPPADAGEPPAPKPGPLASDALRELLTQQWRPAMWSAMLGREDAGP